MRRIKYSLCQDSLKIKIKSELTSTSKEVITLVYLEVSSPVQDIIYEEIITELHHSLISYQ